MAEVHVAPCDWLAGVEGREHFVLQPLPPSASGTHSSPILFYFVLFFNFYLHMCLRV